MTSPSSTSQPPETAKQLILRVTAFTASVLLMLSETPLLHNLGMILLFASSALVLSEKQVARMIPLWLLLFAVYMALALGEIIKPTQSGPPIFHHAFAFVMTGIWTGGVIWEYRKWRSSRSDKQL